MIGAWFFGVTCGFMLAMLTIGSIMNGGPQDPHTVGDVFAWMAHTMAEPVRAFVEEVAAGA